MAGAQTAEQHHRHRGGNPLRKKRPHRCRPAELGDHCHELSGFWKRRIRLVATFPTQGDRPVSRRRAPARCGENRHSPPGDSATLVWNRLVRPATALGTGAGSGGAAVAARHSPSPHGRPPRTRSAPRCGRDWAAADRSSRASASRRSSLRASAPAYSTLVWLTMVWLCSPAGTPNGTWGGPGRPMGVPHIGIPYCGPVTPDT